MIETMPFSIFSRETIFPGAKVDFYLSPHKGDMVV